MTSDINLFDNIIPNKGETFDLLLSHKNIKIVRIVSSEQLDDKIYAQEEDEWVVIIEGTALLEIEGKQKPLSKGDSLFIPAQTPHRVLETSKGTIWLAVHIATFSS